MCLTTRQGIETKTMTIIIPFASIFLFARCYIIILHRRKPRQKFMMAKCHHHLLPLSKDICSNTHKIPLLFKVYQKFISVQCKCSLILRSRERGGKKGMNKAFWGEEKMLSIIYMYLSNHKLSTKSFPFFMDIWLTILHFQLFQLFLVT